MYVTVDLFGFILFGTLFLSEPGFLFPLPAYLKFLAIISSYKVSSPFSLISFLGPYNANIYILCPCLRCLLNCSHFKKFFLLFLFQLAWFPLLCLPVHRSIPLYHLIYYCFLPVYFKISLIVLFSTVGFFIFPLLNFLCIHSFFRGACWTSLWSLLQTFYWVGCLSPLHLVLFLRFCLIISFGL